MTAWELTSGGDEKWLALGYILKIEPKEFADGSHVGCEKKSGVKDDYKVFGLATGKTGVDILWVGEQWERNNCWGEEY